MQWALYAFPVQLGTELRLTMFSTLRKYFELQNNQGDKRQ